MKSYEILPAGMTGSAMSGGGGAKKPKPYEIPPGVGVAAQGLGGWTKGAAAFAQGMATYGAAGGRAFGLPYDPAGVVPTRGEGAVGPTGKPLKSYEILPGTGAAGQGSAGKSGCGCGGACGGIPGAKSNSTVMKKSCGCSSGSCRDESASLNGINNRRILFRDWISRDGSIDFTTLARATSNPPPSDRIGLGGGGNAPAGFDGGFGPGADPCRSIQVRIDGLRSELTRRLDLLGNRANDIVAAWARARRICSNNDPQSLCAYLNQRFADSNPNDRDSYNAAFALALGCDPRTLTDAGFQARKFFACLQAVVDAQRVERNAAEEGLASPPVTFIHDIEPLLQQLRDAQVSLHNCQGSFGGGGVAPLNCNLLCPGPASGILCVICCGFFCNEEGDDPKDCIANCTDGTRSIP